MPDLTPETLAELRRLLDDGTTIPWHLDAGGDRGVYTDPRETIDSRDIANAYYRADEVLIVAAVNALPALLDAAERLAEVEAERDEIAGRLAHLLCDLTGGRLSKTTYPVPVMVQEVEQYLSECHESDLKAERDALAAKVERVRAVHARYFDTDGRPGYDDTSPAPEDVWRFDRDFRAALDATDTDHA